jgi:hypothetical protein
LQNESIWAKLLMQEQDVCKMERSAISVILPDKQFLNVLCRGAVVIRLLVWNGQDDHRNRL